MSLEIKTLVSRLDRNARKVLEQAATLCVSQTHFDVEHEHLLIALIRQKNAVVRAILGRYGIEEEALIGQLEATTGKFKRGNSRTPAFSQRVPELMEAALVISAGKIDSPTIGIPALLLAGVDRDPLRGLILESAPLLEKINVAEAMDLLPELMRVDAPLSKVGEPPSKAATAAAAASGAAPAGPAGSAALDKFTVDLTAEAAAGKLDPVTGRDFEIRQLIDVMMRRRQNNPILVGDPGVGKTAIVEGLALKIASGDVPPSLKDTAVRVLDLGLLQAGAGMKGEFEERLKNVIAEVKAAAGRVVVFIDEAHTMIGAGGAAGHSDAANLLKPALARGEFRTIAATTWAEYKRYFEKDPALTRRFQPIKVGEPDEAAARGMLRGVAAGLETHHGVRILEDAIAAAVSLSARYIPARQLPDKAVSVLDTASARVAIGRAVIPEPLERCDRSLEALALEASRLERHPGGATPDSAEGRRLAEIAETQASLTAEREALNAVWQAEVAILKRLDEAATTGENIAELRAALGPEPLVHWCVDAAVVAAVISEWTGIPIGTLTAGDAETLSNLTAHLTDRVVGQPQAITAISQTVTSHRAGLGEPGRPVGVFLLSGPSGVGKTETAHALADLLYGGSSSLIAINMSEYQEAHSVAKLKGAPPGYVGFGAGGVLTEAVRRRPYSLVLLDEIDKAHPDVLDIFYQVFDKGILEDGEGVEVDFRNTLILMTANIAEDELSVAAARIRMQEDALDAARAVALPPLRQRFPAAFLGRLSLVPYLPLEETSILAIVAARCEKLITRFSADGRSTLRITAEAQAEIARRAMASDTGARTIDQVLNGAVMPPLASALLTAFATETGIALTVDVDAGSKLVVTEGA